MYKKYMALEHIKRLADAKNILINLTNYIEIKTIFVVIALFLLDIDNIEKMYALFVLMALDMATGISSAWVKKEIITSKLAYRTPIKFVVYTSMIIAGALLEKTIGVDVGADESIIIFLAATEFISILENFGKIGFKTPNKLLNSIKEIQQSK